MLALRGASTLTALGARTAEAVPVRPPTTLLGGFLGTGKTTTLTHLLTNRAGLRIGVLVNDVAAVNVDAMSVRRTTVEEDGVEMIQLENGCVCCSAAGDLAPAVASLLQRDDPPFDHVVVELSGVADPMNVQNILGVSGLLVDRKVALVDSMAFPELYRSVQIAGEREDLTGSHTHDDDEPAHVCVVGRPVIELLLQQVETADVILVNKIDLASDNELRTTLAACRALNEKAAILTTTFGDAALFDVLPKAAAAAPQPDDAPASDVEYELMLNGINCGGCGNALTKALMEVEGVAEVSAANKKDTGVHPNKVVVSAASSCTEDAVREAIATLDDGRGKFTVVEPEGVGAKDTSCDEPGACDSSPPYANCQHNDERDSKASNAPVAKDAFWSAAHPKRANEAADWAKLHPKKAAEAQKEFDRAGGAVDQSAENNGRGR